MPSPAGLEVGAFVGPVGAMAVGGMIGLEGSPAKPRHSSCADSGLSSNLSVVDTLGPNLVAPAGIAMQRQHSASPNDLMHGNSYPMFVNPSLLHLFHNLSEGSQQLVGYRWQRSWRELMSTWQVVHPNIFPVLIPAIARIITSNGFIPLHKCVHLQF